MVNADGRVIYAWYLGNFDFIKPKSLTFQGRLFMLDPFKGCNQSISGGGGAGPSLTQESQYSQISEFEYEEEYEESEPDHHFMCCSCGNPSFDEKVNPHECPKCHADFCRYCIVWYLNGNVVASKEEAGEDLTFLCVDCHDPEPLDPATDGDSLSSSEGIFQPVVHGIDGQQLYDGRTDI